ncbi:MAG: ribosome maturation factor RimM [Flavipsychrobacter sp.]
MVRIGKIVATHGLQGTVILKHIVEKSNWLKANDVLFVALRKGSNIPYFVQEVKEKSSDEQHILLEEITTMEDAKVLVGKDVYVSEDVLGKTSKESPLMWVGFNIVDKTVGGIGEIADVMQAGQQWIATVMYEDNEVLIPLVEEIILDINIRNRYLRVDLPDGLLDVYTGDSNDED